jgi:hypothetical protein
MALSRYQKDAREILVLYGSEPEFTEILRTYGESVIPVIQYFRENDVWSVTAIDASARTLQSFRELAKQLWNRLTGDEQTDPPAALQPQPSELGPTERGWYAVNFIKKEGHDFLGQFVVSQDNKVKWNQTDRIVKAVTSFFTGGVRALETKSDLGEDIAVSDVFWAGLDVALVAAPIKLLRAGKAVARSGEELSLTTRTRLFAPRLLSKGQIFQKLGKYGAVAATLYVVASNPSLINSLLVGIAKSLGWDPWLVQFMGWFLIIAVVLYPFPWLLKGLARLILYGFSWLDRPGKRTTKAAIEKIPPAAPGAAEV